MPKYRLDPRLALVLRDFALGLSVFTCLSLASGAGNSSFVPGESGMFSSAAFAAASPDGHLLTMPAQPPLAALVSLGLVFAAMVAVNLGFYRHLRRVYASPRASAWRRGGAPKG